MGISPWYKTSTPTAPGWTISLVPDSGFYDVTGLVTLNFSLLMRNLDTGIETNGQGTFSNITAAVTVSSGVTTSVITHASVQYQAAAADVALGRYQLYVLISRNGGVQPFAIPEIWEVLPL